MSKRIEFGSKAAADTARVDHSEFLCSGDDRRLKTVTFSSNLPDAVEEELRASAETGRVERESGAGQLELSDAEKRRVGPFSGENNYRKAAAVKALLTANGVDDWESWYDPTLSVDEHRSSVLPQARESGGGARNSSEEAKEQREQRARSVERAVGSRCDHARGHCEHGDPDACEFLTENCDYDPEEVAVLLDPDETDEAVAEIGGKDAGVLGRAWGGYQGATSELEDVLDVLESEWQHAQQAARAINRVREAHGQEAIHFEKLEAVQGRLRDLVREAAADCHECHAATESGRESL